MNEKEFLESFIKHLDDEDFDLIPRECIEPAIRNFLEEHHKTYGEVEFVTLTEEQEWYKRLEAIWTTNTSS